MSSVAEISHNAEFATLVAANLKAVGDVLPRFTSTPSSADRAYWANLDKDMCARLVAEGEAALLENWHRLSADAYRAFTETGNRIDYEKAYFARRRKLNALALAEAVTADGRFMDAMVDGIKLICAENGWQLPAHNAHARGGPRDPLPDPDRPVIDLFAAETGAQLAVLAQLHAEALNAIDPGIVDRIDREIETRITTPYLAQHFWWMGNGDEPMNNWTAWCTQNVLVSTFARSTSQSVRHAVLQKAAYSLDAFLKDYADDGACAEGALYYRHAALCLFGAMSVMDTVAPRAFAHLWQNPKIRNMAEFILHMHVGGDNYLNFADSSAILAPCGAREFLFGKAVGSDALSDLAATDAQRNPHSELPDEINLWYRLLALATADEMTAVKPHVAVKPNIYYPGCGLFIARDAQFTIAAKAGDNGDDHNHNDVGSVIIHKNGQPFLIDVGVETYTAKTFSQDRYDIWTMQSGFHNLPGFEGVQQQAGASFAARDVQVKLEGDASQISMDIAGAYPAEAGVAHYRRTVKLLKGSAVEIVDSHDGSRTAELSLMLSEKSELEDGHIRVGDLGMIALEGAGEIRIEEIAITDPRLRQAWPDRIYRLLVPFQSRELRLKIT